MINCPICGNPFNPYTNGRAKTYCSKPCGHYNKYKNALEKAINQIKPTPSSAKLIKGDMFRLRNLIPNGTKSLREIKK